MKRKILSTSIILLCVLCLFRFAVRNTGNKAIKPVVGQEQVIQNNTEEEACEVTNEWQNLLAQNDRLLPIEQITYPYWESATPSASFGVDEYRSGKKIYSEAEASEIPFSIFDEKKRLVYALTPISGITNTINEYTIHGYEENVYERNDKEHSCRHIYYQSDVSSYDLTSDSCYYVSSWNIREVEDWQFSENGNLISYLQYSPNRVGGETPSSALYGTKLYFNNGYQAEYDGNYLISEILWRYSQGAWTFHVYQYDDTGNRILEIVVADYKVTLYAYEYNHTDKQVTRYAYLIDGEWKLTCKDGSVYSFYSGYPKQLSRPAVRKTDNKGTVILELFYQETCDIGQQDYLIAEKIEEETDIHNCMITQPGDSLWRISEQYYGNGGYNDILYQVNQGVIGFNKDRLLSGIRLYIPKIWTSTDSIFYF